MRYKSSPTSCFVQKFIPATQSVLEDIKTCIASVRLSDRIPRSIKRSKETVKKRYNILPNDDFVLGIDAKQHWDGQLLHILQVLHSNFQSNRLASQ